MKTSHFDVTYLLTQFHAMFHHLEDLEHCQGVQMTKETYFLSNCHSYTLRAQGSGKSGSDLQNTQSIIYYLSIDFIELELAVIE